METKKNIWFKFEKHDYMDMFPEIFFQSFPDVETARNYAKYMQENYSGGTTTFIGYALKQEVLNYVKDNNLSLSEEIVSEINDDEMYYGSQLPIITAAEELLNKIKYAIDRDEHACLPEAIDALQEALFKCEEVTRLCEDLYEHMCNAYDQE